MRKLKLIGSVVCALLLFWGMFSVADYCLMIPLSRQKYQQFLADDSKYDVLFFGSSHVTNGISPLDLFHKHGIVSYNFAPVGNYMATAYYQLEELAENFSRKLPDVVVLDIYNDVPDMENGNLHRGLDVFASNRRKWEMINAIGGGKKWLEFMFPFSIYHNRWNEGLVNVDNDIDLLGNRCNLYGAGPRYEMYTLENELIRDRNDKMEYAASDKEYLEKIWMLCKKRGMKLILINMPYACFPKRQKQANDLYEFAALRGIPYVNYMNEKIPFDFNIDMSDKQHVNPVGMRIMTDEVGKLLLKEGVKDRRREPVAARWHKEYRDYVDFRIRRLQKITDIKIFLMALNDPDLSVKLQVNKRLLDTEKIRLLVNRLRKIKGNEVKLVSGKATHTRLNRVPRKRKCDLSAIVYRNGKERQEVYRARFDGFHFDKESAEAPKEWPSVLEPDAALAGIKDINDYLAVLRQNKDRYTVLIAVKDEASMFLSPKTRELLKDLGLEADWKDAHQKSYYAVIARGDVVKEDMAAAKLSASGSFGRGAYEYSIESMGFKVGNGCSIKINGREYALDGRGLNIIVFNHENKKMDSVCFDTRERGNKASRHVLPMAN